MMTLLRSLHAIAAQRGDGLRPEFLEMTTPSPAWSNIEALVCAPAKTDAKRKPERWHPDADVVTFPIQKRRRILQGLRCSFDAAAAS